MTTNPTPLSQTAYGSTVPTGKAALQGLPRSLPSTPTTVSRVGFGVVRRTTHPPIVFLPHRQESTPARGPPPPGPFQTPWPTAAQPQPAALIAYCQSPEPQQQPGQVRAALAQIQQQQQQRTQQAVVWRGGVGTLRTLLSPCSSSVQLRETPTIAIPPPGPQGQPPAKRRTSSTASTVSDAGPVVRHPPTTVHPAPQWPAPSRLGNSQQPL